MRKSAGPAARPHARRSKPARRPGTRRGGEGASTDGPDVRTRLQAELAAAEARLRGIEPVPPPDERPPTGPDSVFDETDHIHSSQAQEIRLVTRERLMARVERLRAALDRLARGEYGRCVECGEPIGRARLAALPEVERCVECQERAERRRRADGGRAA
jgi:RNA polymerase-binding transcription factor DksA